MLVTFSSKAGGSVTMFGEIAIRLLRMAGHTGTVPSALLASQIPDALARLKSGLAAGHEEGIDHAPAAGDDAEAPRPVELRVRAHPLIQLLSAAADQKCDVVWDKDRPMFP
jgi:hypothetical protein